MRFASLGSGSRGNATLISHGDTCVLLDCGFTVREIERRLAQIEVRPEDLSAILVTHEHGDHASGVAALARRYGLSVWMTHGTYAMLRDHDIPALCLIDAHTPRSLGALEVQPFPVPHDAAEPCQFAFCADGARLGVLTDAGSITPHVAALLDGCSSLVLECNHDGEMLRSGPYPPSLQQRVASAYGHLENGQAAALLRRIDAGALQTLVLAHLSQHNNTTELALRAVCEALDCAPDWPRVLDQDACSPWFEVE